MRHAIAGDSISRFEAQTLPDIIGILEAEVLPPPTPLKWIVVGEGVTLIFSRRMMKRECRHALALAVSVHQRNEPSMLDATTIRIAAALIDDGEGQTLLVRKAGTKWFMQAGGKIEAGESPVDALCRELREEIGFSVDRSMARHLGCFVAPAANEPGRSVQAELFHVRIAAVPAPSLEIEEAVWADQATAEVMSLAPLTRDHVLPLFSALVANA